MENAFSKLKIAFTPRLLITGFIWALCITMQLIAESLLVGVGLAFVSWFFLHLKPLTNRPSDKGLEEWRAVEESEVIKVLDNVNQSKQMKKKLEGGKGLKVLVFIGLLIGFIINFAGDDHKAVFFLDALLFFFPGLFFGHANIFIPLTFQLKMTGFLSLMNIKLPPNFRLTPYLRFDKDKDNLDVPEDIRFMLELKRKPEDLIGVQFQMAINNGAYGAVPYLYAVILTKGKGTTHKTLSQINMPGYHVEVGGDKEYGTVVIRQLTKGTGYHTKDEHCIKLFESIIENLTLKLPK